MLKSRSFLLITTQILSITAYFNLDFNGQFTIADEALNRQGKHYFTLTNSAKNPHTGYGGIYKDQERLNIAIFQGDLRIEPIFNKNTKKIADFEGFLLFAMARKI